MAEETDPIAEFEMNKRKQLERLAAAPLVEMVGLVGPNGPAGGKVGGDALWTLILDLVAWRVGGGDLCTGSLRVSRTVTDAELKRFRGIIAPFTIIKIRARLDLDATPRQALLEHIVQTEATDSELHRCALELQKPVTQTDSVLGRLTLDRRVNLYTGQSEWNGTRVTIYLSADKSGDLAPTALRTAHDLWQHQAAWGRRVSDYAVAALLPLKNESWLDEDEAELASGQFKARMTLESISAHSDETFEFWHNDGDLFWGHSIVVGGNLTDGPNDAGIHG